MLGPRSRPPASPQPLNYFYLRCPRRPSLHYRGEEMPGLTPALCFSCTEITAACRAVPFLWVSPGGLTPPFLAEGG